MASSASSLALTITDVFVTAPVAFLAGLIIGALAGARYNVTRKNGR